MQDKGNITPFQIQDLSFYMNHLRQGYESQLLEPNSEHRAPHGLDPGALVAVGCTVSGSCRDQCNC